MPVMGGIEACERIQQLPKSCHPNRIIALTADVFKENKEKCLKSGMVEVLNKPIDREELVRVLVKYVK
jgi:CheY-like chemotaxis protein